MRRKSVAMAWRVLATEVLACGLLSGAIAHVRVAGVTATQAVLRYQAPDNEACTVEVSENAGFTPLVHDVNPALFTGADSDSRTGAITLGLERTFVVGQRKIELTSDSSRFYSRGLQSATQHYFRITCGGDTATGEFTTSPVMPGQTRIELPYTPHPTIPGSYVGSWRDMGDRDAGWVDPHTGAYIRNVSVPGDTAATITDQGATAGVNNNVNFQSTALGTNWTDPDGILASGGASAIYTGASCGAECDKLAIFHRVGWDTNTGLDYLRFRLTGSGSDADAENRKVYACVVYGDQSDCGDAYSRIYEMTLPTTSGTVEIGSTNAGDTLRLHYMPGLSISQISSSGANRGLRFLIWKKTSTGSVSIDYAQFDMARSHGIGTGGGGNNLRCSKTADGEGFFWCTGISGGGAGHTAYRIHGDTGEVRYVGRIPNISVPGVGSTLCGDEYGGFHHPTIPNRFYCSYSGRLYRQDYIGDGLNKTTRYTGQAADWTATEVLASIPTAVETFVSTNSAHYPIAYDPAKFSACVFRGMKNSYIMLHCLRGNADTYAWIVALNDSGQVAAAMPNWTHPKARWCSVHSYEEIGDQNVHMYTSQVLNKNITGGGPYYVQLASAVLAGDSTISVNSISPTSSYADATLMNLAVGDPLLINNTEFVRITSISGSGPYTLGVTRGLNNTSAQGHSSGVNVLPYCGSQTSIGVLMQVWDFVNDPYGEDTTDTYVWNRSYGGHQTTRRHRMADNTLFTIGSPGQYLIKDRVVGTTGSAPDDPKFAGQGTGTPGLTYQTHPSFHNELETGQRADWWIDVRPLIGGGAIAGWKPSCNVSTSAGCAAERVSGFSNVYKWDRSGFSDPPGPALSLTSKLFPNFGMIGRSGYLRNVSGPGSVISDGDHYTWCEAYAADECVSGSLPGGVYLNPGTDTINAFYCTGGENFNGGIDICLFPAQQQTSALMQFGALVDPSGARNTRVLAREGLGYHGRNLGSLVVAKALGTGSWILARAFKDKEGLVLVKTPPLQPDSRNRATFQAIPVTVPSIAPGTDNVIAEFGYDGDFQCNENRPEKCLAVSASLNQSNPYQYGVEGTGGVESGLTGVPCSTSCTVTIPALPGRVLYYRLKYRDAAGATLASGLTQVVTVK